MQLHRAQNDVPSAWGLRVTIAVAQAVGGEEAEAEAVGVLCRVDDAHPPAAPMPMPSASQPSPLSPPTLSPPPWCSGLGIDVQRSR